MGNSKTPWTDVLADNIAGLKDYWLLTEGDTITVDATGVINLTAGFHNVAGAGPINTINGATRNGQFVVLRFAESSQIEFVPGGNIRAGQGVRVPQRWTHLLFRDGYWEEQVLPLGDFSSGVVTFEGRTGNVISVAGDYSAPEITATDPTGSGGTQVQQVLDNLNTEISALENTVNVGGFVKSFAGRQNVVVPVSGDYTAPIVPMTPFTVSSTTIPGPTTQDALQQIVAAIGGVAPGGVLTFNARTGNVVPLVGDYSAGIIAATDPTQGGASSDTQTVLNHLNTKIDNIPSGGGGGITEAIVSIQHAQGTFGPGSTYYPTWVIEYGQISSALVSSTQIPDSGGVTNGLAAGSVYDQIAALAYREGYSIAFNSTYALNQLIKGANSLTAALCAIPDGLLTYAGNNGTIGNWTNSGSWTFSGPVTFSGAVSGIAGLIEIGNGSNSSMNQSVGGGTTSYGNESLPPAGSGWYQIGFVITGGSNGPAAVSFSGNQICATVARDSSYTVSASGYAVYARPKP